VTSPIRVWNRFWFGPISARPLGAFRIVFGLIVLLNLALLAPEAEEWLSDAGRLGGPEARELAGPFRPSPLQYVQDPATVRLWLAATAVVAMDEHIGAAHGSIGRGAKAGLVFAGPTPEQIRRFGLKHEARALADPVAPARDLRHHQQHGQGIALPAHLVVPVHPAEAIEQAFAGGEDRGEEGALAVEHARHVPAERLGQRDDDRTIENDLEPTDHSHGINPSGFGSGATAAGATQGEGSSR